MTLAQTLEASLHSGTDPVTPLLDLSGFIRDEWAEEVRQAYRQGLESGARALGESLVGLVRNGGLVQVVDQPDPALVRLRLRRGGFNYVDLRLNAEGGVVDWYVYDLGEWFSESHARLSPIASAEEKLTPTQKALLESAGTVSEMHAALLAGRWSSVLISYFSLPQVLQRERGCLRMRVSAAMNLDETSYSEALNTYLRQFPGDGGLDLMSIDGFLLLGKIDESLASAKRLEARVNDPVLGNLRAGVLVRAGRADAAIATLAEVTERAPTDPQAYWGLIGLMLERREFSEVAKWLTRIDRQAGVALRDLRTISEYKEFVQSPEGRGWLSSRAN